ncbi:MAG: ATP-binding protein [Halioglobus sp.]|nr:ATP-binding protein [Halioglobus sp.]
MAYKELSGDELYTSCRLQDDAFDSTAELEPMAQPPGQRRALEALQFGVDIKEPGFNLFALGASGVGKRALLMSVLNARADKDVELFDWCYISNFSNPQQPRLLKLTAGVGRELSKDMLQLVEDLLTALPTSFQEEDYRSRRQEIEDEVSETYEQDFRKLGEEAQNQGIALLRTPAGYTLAPTRDGAIVTPEEFAKLTEEERAEIEKKIADLQVELQRVVSQLPMMRRETAHRIKALNQEITRLTVEQFVALHCSRYEAHPEIIDYLGEVKEYAIENAEDFLPPDGETEVDHVKQRAKHFSAFQVNVLVDNKDVQGEPVVFEDNPTYQNLVGRVEYVSQMGTLLTDFTLIRAGALHRANGGYLIVDAANLLRHIYAWEGLKQSLKSGEIKITSLQEMLSLNSTISLQPESVPMQVKVVLVGEPWIYYLMDHYDPEFRQHFRVAADFSAETQASDENQLSFARMIASLVQDNNLQALDIEAVRRVIEQSARAAEDGEKLSLDLDRLTGLLQEANYWAKADGSELVRLQHVEKALDAAEDRHGKMRELMGEQILREIKLVATQGQQSGQVNGLSVLQLGQHSFGLPSRITATARLGRGKVIDIERESKLGGDIHSKGVLILSAYLANRYASEQPLPLSASLVFEQSYGGVDGDSATCAEVCALLSAITGIPIKQNLAVTGSMNQMGEVQAIGGVNEKIEGYFDLCDARGLTGDQGVIIPAANQVHLMLAKRVREAVAAGRFAIYTAGHVDDVMTLLSGVEAPEVEDQVKQRITELLDVQKSLEASGDEKD